MSVAQYFETMDYGPAPESDGATSVSLNKGDMLVIRRGTPHKRTTKGTVTFTLISTVGTPSA